MRSKVKFAAGLKRDNSSIRTSLSSSPTGKTLCIEKDCFEFWWYREFFILTHIEFYLKLNKSIVKKDRDNLIVKVSKISKELCGFLYWMPRLHERLKKGLMLITTGWRVSYTTLNETKYYVLIPSIQKSSALCF